MTIPTVDTVRAIAAAVRDVPASPDPTAAALAVNRDITAVYHLLSEALAVELGTADLDWCGFAKWSSNTVGHDLDPLKPGDRVEHIVDNEAFDLVPTPVKEAVRDALRTARNLDGIALEVLHLGNAVIFLEMGLVFVRLLEQFSEQVGRADGDESFARALVDEVLEETETPAWVDNRFAPHLLVAERTALEAAIVSYLVAARSPAARSELIWKGNMNFSVYEQKRADALLTIGMCAPVRTMALDQPLVGFVVPDRDTVLLAHRDNQLPLFEQIDRMVTRALTEYALVVVVAGEAVPLGQPLPVTGGVQPTDPATVAFRDGLVSALTGVPDWTDFDYRLGFIATYFATYQRDKPQVRDEPTA